MLAQNNLDHNILLELGFFYQATPHAENGMVYCRKQGICRGDIFLKVRQVKKGTPPMYDIWMASYWEKEHSAEFLRDVTTVGDLELFYLHGLNTKTSWIAEN